jgi:hypothetical protein
VPKPDNAPEVITGCQAGSTDMAYDLNTGAQLGSNPCGNNPDECSIGNTCGNTLDYMATPNLASYEEVGVIETIPSSTYVSATAVPPQLSAITVNGSQATFNYYGKVVCQGTSTDPNTISQFSWESPYTNLQASGKMYASGIACPPSAGATSITVSWPSTIPFSSSVRFKYEAYGQGHFIVGAPGSTFAGQREASESAYAGPTAAITSFTPPTTTTPTSSGGSVNAAFATTNAHTCSIGATSVPAAAAALTLPSVASCNGTGTITVPANTSSTTNAVYTVTLTATGVAGTPAATASITITVPAASTPVPVNTSPPTIAGTTTQGQTLTESHGSWSNSPTGYTYQWQDCDSTGNNCSPVLSNGTAQTYKLTVTDVGSTIRVQETASNAGGPGTPALSAATAVVSAPSAPQGSWVGTFGSSGYDLGAWNGGADVASMPGVSVSLLQGSRYVWASNTSDLRALQSAGQSSRTAATYYDANQIRVQLSFSTAYSGNLELYALDWDSGGRRETITVGQTANLTTDFTQGAWITFPINAAANSTITITVNPTAGNAVLSGIFLN